MVLQHQLVVLQKTNSIIAAARSRERTKPKEDPETETTRLMITTTRREEEEILAHQGRQDHTEEATGTTIGTTEGADQDPAITTASRSTEAANGPIKVGNLYIKLDFN